MSIATGRVVISSRLTQSEKRDFLPALRCTLSLGVDQVSEPIIVVVVLKALAAEGELAGIQEARSRLLEWADTHAVEVQPPAEQSADALRFANLLVHDEERAPQIEDLLKNQVFVDAVYAKPPDELP